MNINIQPGDIFLVDSQKTGAKIVKFFQTAPTWIQHIWRKIRGTQEKVLYYHVGMFYNSNQIIEQQGKVILRSANKLLSTGNEVMIFRKKGITSEQQKALQSVALNDLDEGYDIVNIFGKLFTWLTGIPYFARYMQLPNQDICVNRGAYWWLKAVNVTFGVKTHSELTTHNMYKYVMAHPDEFEIIYRGIPREDKLL
jgi:uncharacterized protein YycO